MDSPLTNFGQNRMLSGCENGRDQRKYRSRSDSGKLVKNFFQLSFPDRYLRGTLAQPEETPCHKGELAVASRNSSKRNQRASKATARRRRRAVGLGGSAGAFLALGLGPLAPAPAAHADPFDVILDPSSTPSPAPFRVRS